MRKLLCFILITTPSFAARFYVDTDAPIGGDGSSWPSAFNFLQDALNQTVSGRGDEVWVAAGTYYPDDGSNVTEGDRTASFSLVDQVALYGGFQGGEVDVATRDTQANPTVLSGEIFDDLQYWSLHIVMIEGASTLDSVRIEKSNANNGSGAGGITVIAGRLTLVNSEIQNNYSSSAGGAIYLGSNSMEAYNCIFKDNIGALGGAIMGSSLSSNFSDFKDCKFISNEANVPGVTAYGGAVCSLKARFDRCAFDSNYSRSDGGAIYSGTAIFTDSTFTNNDAFLYGGVAASTSYTTKFYNCIFSTNTAWRGGVFSGNGHYSAINCVVENNSSDGYGIISSGGYRILINSTLVGNHSTLRFSQSNALFSNTRTTLLHCIFWNNLSESVKFTMGTVDSYTATLESLPSPLTPVATNLIEGGWTDWTGPTPIVLTENPLFIDPTDPDGADNIWGTADDGLRLQVSSPALSLGNVAFLPVDEYDLDTDDDISEQIPYDITESQRVQGIELPTCQRSCPLT